jgi:hypothetical protein
VQYAVATSFKVLTRHLRGGLRKTTKTLYYDNLLWVDILAWDLSNMKQAGVKFLKIVCVWSLPNIQTRSDKISQPYAALTLGLLA